LHLEPVKFFNRPGLDITTDHQSIIGKKLLMISGKQGFQPEKAGKVMTADHHDRELWEHYFRP
jgi:hypothetical protein